MAKRKYEFSPVEKPGVKYEITLESTLLGYTATVLELHSVGATPVSPRGIRYEIQPPSFYAKRSYYRGVLLGDVMAQLRTNALDNVVGKSFIRANMAGWPDGYSGACEDELQDAESIL